MTEDVTADLQGSPHLLIAFMDEHEFAHVCEAAMGLAKRSGARIILYDRDAASGWGDPLPTWWSAAGEREQYGDPLSQAELSKLGRGVLARKVAAARAEGVDAWGWLPAEHGTNHAVDYARRHGADAVLLPAELDEPGLVDRLRRQTVAQALQTAEEATDSPAILLVDRNGQIRPAGRPLHDQSEP
jgi:nucleotide-binding universal stress UspA family protein